MPTYVYRREDGTKFEIEQRITEDPLETCPTTGQKVTRIISGNAGLVFKGSGFYLTDYARNGSNGSSNAASNGSGSTKSEGSAGASTSAGRETKNTASSPSND